MTPFEQAYFDYASCESENACVIATAAMLRLTPNSQFTAYLHAITLRWNSKPHATDSILRGLDGKNGELRGRIYYFLHYAGVLHALGEYERELVVAQVGRAQYPGRMYIVPAEYQALIALGRLGDAGRAIDALFTMAPDQRNSAFSNAVTAIYELRWHGHPAEADALGEKLRRRVETAGTPTGDASKELLDTRGRLELLAAMHR